MRWADEMVPGRVFELRSASRKLKPPCILILDPDARYNEQSAVQIYDYGIADDGYRPGNVRIVNAWQWRRRDMTSAKIKRRRRDLERFDPRDLALIQYGCKLKFGGRVWGGPTKARLPCFPGTRWTIFWTKSARYAFGADGRSYERRLRDLLDGAWWVESWCGGDWTFGRDSRLRGWATEHRDPARLRAIERALRDQHGHLERCEFEMVTVGLGDRVTTFPRGQVGPAFSAPGRSTRFVDGGEVWSYP